MGRQKRLMLMNVVDPEEIRVAVVGADGLENLYLERTGGGFLAGNIYKGTVQNIEPSLQAAFIDIGGEKNGFLHVSDVVAPDGGYKGILKKKRTGKKQKDVDPESRGMPIEQMLFKGQEVLVQVTRESIGKKGPSVSTFISFPGRYLVMMPAVKKRGVSRKIRNGKERKLLLDALNELNPPDDMGFIIRTAGMNRGQEDLKKDLDYLLRLWKSISLRAKKITAPALIYEESDLVIRAVRDFFQEDFDGLLIDREDEYARASEFLKAVMPTCARKAELYTEPVPLFSKYGVDDAVEKLYARRIELQSGGSIIIESTEALVAIDVNSGRSHRDEDSRDMILKINLEAAAVISRQIRLRDLGGLVMVDFIDMDEERDRREVEQAFRRGFKDDKARITMLPISQLGVLEMTRQRIRKSLRNAVLSPCPYCGGMGVTKSGSSLAIDFVRRLGAELAKRPGHLEVRMHPRAALYVCNFRRAEIAALEKEYGVQVHVLQDDALALDAMDFRRIDDPERFAVLMA